MPGRARPAAEPVTEIPSTEPTSAPWSRAPLAGRWLRRPAFSLDSLGPAVARLDLDRRLYGIGVAACTAAVAVFLLAQLSAWPPHEDEALALFVGRESLGGLFEVVLGNRGGAPLHFVLAWLVAHAGGGLTGLRLVSAFFAVASVPVIAALCARLGDRVISLVATAIVSASWAMLFHGIYGRMYSLFLCSSALSFLALLRALERGGRRAWLLWALAILATIATHPYGALVLAAQGLYVLLVRTRLREACLAFGAVLVAGTPFWRSDLVLAGRFEVGVGGGGEKLGGPLSVLRYLGQVAGDFSAGYPLVLTAVLAVSALGLWYLRRERPRSALLVGSVFGVPTLAFLVARLGSSTSPESRHLIFALPFFGLLLGVGLVRLARRTPRGLGPLVALAGVAVLVPAEVSWGWHKTPPLFTGEPWIKLETRAAASDWLARTSRPDDVLFGYDPLFLGAWERSDRFPHTVVPRADPRLALKTLRALDRPLGRGVWVFDRDDNNNWFRRLYVPLRAPKPASEYETAAYGPFLIIRTRERTLTPRGYLEHARRVMLVGKDLYIGDADINFLTVVRALERLDAGG